MVWVVHTVLPAADTVGIGLTTKELVALAVQPSIEVIVVEYTPALAKLKLETVLLKAEEEKMFGPDQTAAVPPLTLSTAALPSHFGELEEMIGVGEVKIKTEVVVVEVQPRSEPITVYCVFVSGLSLKVMFALELAAVPVTLALAAGGSQV